jgi:hypothetical protein
MRSIERAPLWDEPLSTTQNTRRAEAYGSVVMTWATSFSKGSIPVLGAMWPSTRA